MTQPLARCDSVYWEMAFRLAEEALHLLEVPVGCVFVHYDKDYLEGEVIGTGSNATNRTKNPTRHAELEALDEVKRWCREREQAVVEVMAKATLYVTLEPCIMCASALYQLGIQKIVFGACNPRFGGLKTVASNALYGHEHHIEILSEVDAQRSVDLLKKFYEMENPNAPDEKRKTKGKILAFDALHSSH